MSDGLNIYCILECFGGPLDGETRWLIHGEAPFDERYYLGVHPLTGEPCWFYSASSPESPRP